MKECTFYIEEVLSDHDNDDDKDKCSQTKNNQLLQESFQTSCRVDIPPCCKDQAEKSTEFLVDRASTQESCPIQIGGGSTATLIKQKLYVIGGCNRSGSPPSSALHCYDFDTKQWHCDVQCKGDLPVGRFAHTAVARHSKIFVFGGQACRKESKISSFDNTMTRNFKSLNCVYCLDTELLEWTKIKTIKSSFASTTGVASKGRTTSPEPRNSHSCVLSKDNEYMIIFGGANDDIGPMNDVWAFDLKEGCHEWIKIPCCDYSTTTTTTTTTTSTISNDACSVKVPEAREMHAACIDETTNTMYIVGGRNINGNACQDVWTLDLASKVWMKISNIPSPRCAHTTNIIRSHDSQKKDERNMIVIFGGWNGTNHIYNDFVVYDINEKSWQSETSLMNAKKNIDVVPRFGHASCVGRSSALSEVIVFGGVNPNNDLSDIIIIRSK